MFIEIRSETPVDAACKRDRPGDDEVSQSVYREPGAYRETQKEGGEC